MGIRTRLALSTLAAFAFSLCAAGPAGAQDPPRWNGFHATVTFGPAAKTLGMRESTETILQVTNLTIPGPTIVIVPATVRSVPAADFGKTAFLTGIHAGIDRQLGSWVFGAEAGVEFGAASGEATTSFALPATALTPITSVTTTRAVSSGSNWSVRARVGRDWHSLLLYATAGFAGGRAKITATDTWFDPGGPGTAGTNFGVLGPYVTTAHDSRHLTGFTGGVGVERRFRRSLSVGAEYRYTRLGAGTFSLDDPSVDVQGPVVGATLFQGASAAALPGNTPLMVSDNRLSVRISLRLR